MKKIYLIAMMAVMSLAVSAQQTLQLSTYNGTKLEKFNGTECQVTANRYVFHGWNTLSLPFALTENELNEIFGADCRLERLVGVESNGRGLVLNFQDCKAEGVDANVPYILYFTGENSNKKISKQALITDAPAQLTFVVDGTGETVSMVGAQKHLDGAGFYGILAKDNAEALFTAVPENSGGFYATRCYVKVGSGNSVSLSTNHLAAGEATAINGIANTSKRADVYNLSGVKVASKANLSQLKPGVYVVDGQKVVVK